MIIRCQTAENESCSLNVILLFENIEHMIAKL
jgi:hypothetical protein